MLDAAAVEVVAADRIVDAASAGDVTILDASSDAATGDVRPAGHIETSLYELSFDGMKRCSTGVDPGASRATWVGAAIRVKAKLSELFVTPGDFTLEQGGIIVAARHVNAPNLPGCMPLLLATQLRGGQSLRGFVLFEVPARFRKTDAPIILAHRPTRWGGARRVEFPIPSCLDVCADSSAAEKSAKTSRTRSRARSLERRTVH